MIIQKKAFWRFRKKTSSSRHFKIRSRTISGLTLTRTRFTFVRFDISVFFTIQYHLVSVYCLQYKTTNIRVIFALSIPPHPTLAPPHMIGRRPLSRSLDFASTVCASSLGSISAALSGRASELFLFREEEGRRKAAREEGPSDRRLSLFEILPRDPSPEKRPRPHLRERRKSRVEWSRRQHVHSSFIKLIKWNWICCKLVTWEKAVNYFYKCDGIRLV